MASMNDPQGSTERLGPELASPVRVPVVSRSPRAMLGRYEVTGQLGAGGMGEVLRVRDPAIGREVAAKLVRDGGDPLARLKLEREAAIIGVLEHPGIIPLYEMGRDDEDVPYYTMRCVSGVDLDRLLDAPQPPALAECLAIFVRVCEAMAYAHSRGVVHRDLKPANILRGAFGEVYVCDWGLAKRLGTRELDVLPTAAALEDDPLATRAGTILGTPAYMAPEQADGNVAGIDARTDVYALGAILYQMLTGEPPHDGATVWAVLASVSSGPPIPPSLRAKDRHVPWELEAIALKALQTAPAARYATARELVADVEAYLAGRLVSAARYGAIAAARKWLAAHPRLVGAIAAAFVAALLVGFAFDARARADEARRVADHAERADRAREGVRASNAPALVTAAAAIALDENPARRTLAAAGALTEQGALITGLQQASRALQELRRLEPEDAAARRALYDVLLALGRVAEARLEDQLAVLAYDQAAGLGEADESARALAHRAGLAGELRLRHRCERIEARLAEARSGALASQQAYVAAVAELAGYRERQTVLVLLPVVADGIERLRGAARAELEKACPGDANLRAELEAYLDPADLVPKAARLVALRPAIQAIEARASRDQHGHRLDWRTTLAHRQASALAEGRVDRARCLELACHVLGLLRDPDGVIAPLACLACADLDELRAASAGAALAHLAAMTPEAERMMLHLVGLGPGQWALNAGRFPLVGPFVAQLREIARAERSESQVAEPVTVDEWCRRGVALYFRGDGAAAVRAFDRAIALEPQSAELYTYRANVRDESDVEGVVADRTRALELAPDDQGAVMLADALRRAGSFEAALRAIDAVLKHEPPLPAALQVRAELRRVGGDLDGALADLDRAIELEPDVPRLTDRGAIRQARGQLAYAITDYSRALELEPRRAELYSRRGTAYAAQGDYARSLKDHTRAMELDPSHPSICINRGNVLQLAGDLAGAQRDYERALELDPRSTTARLDLALVLRRRGEHVRALEELDLLLGAAPEEVQALIVRGELHQKLARPERAFADFARAAELDPRSPLPWRKRGRLHQVLGQLPEAIEALGQAIELDPKDAATLATRAWLRTDQGDHDAAIADATRAIEVDPLHGPAFRYRGVARSRKGDADGALADLDRAVELQPDDALNVRNRSYVHAQRGNQAGVIADCTRLVELDPRDIQAYIDRGLAQSQLGDHAASVADNEAALALAPSSWRARANLGVSLHHLGRREEAIAQLRKARELAPAERHGQIDSLIATIGGR